MKYYSLFINNKMNCMRSYYIALRYITRKDRKCAILSYYNCILFILYNIYALPDARQMLVFRKGLFLFFVLILLLVVQNQI